MSKTRVEELQKVAIQSHFDSCMRCKSNLGEVKAISEKIGADDERICFLVRQNAAHASRVARRVWRHLRIKIMAAEFSEVMLKKSSDDGTDVYRWEIPERQGTRNEYISAITALRVCEASGACEFAARDGCTAEQFDAVVEVLERCGAQVETQELDGGWSVRIVGHEHERTRRGWALHNGHLIPLCKSDKITWVKIAMEVGYVLAAMDAPERLRLLNGFHHSYIGWMLPKRFWPETAIREEREEVAILCRDGRERLKSLAIQLADLSISPLDAMQKCMPV